MIAPVPGLLGRLNGPEAQHVILVVTVRKETTYEITITSLGRENAPSQHTSFKLNEADINIPDAWELSPP